MKNLRLLIIIFLIIKPAFAKYNILLISVCSLNKNHLPFYGYDRMTAPHLSNFAKGAFIFDNVYTSLPWSNISRYTQHLKKDPASNEYSFISNDRPDKVFYFASEEDSGPQKKLLKDKIRNRTSKLFFAQLHFKKNHYPYLIYPNPDLFPKNHPDFTRRNLNFSFLSAKDLSHLNDRLKQKNLSWADLPFLEVMFTDYRKYYPKTARPSKNTIWLYSQKHLEGWKGLPTFLLDLRVVQNAYDGKIRVLDDELGDVLSLFNDKNLQKNTILIFIGDHGETFMSHNTLHAAQATYDEQIMTPLIIKFPEMKATKRIQNQLSQASVVKIIQAITSGTLSEKNFEAFIEKNFKEEEFIYSINCSGTSTSVRYNNQWKLIKWSNPESYELYDLLNDPNETSNLYKSKPKILGTLEEKLFLHNFKKDLEDQTWGDRCSSGKN